MKPPFASASARLIARPWSQFEQQGDHDQVSDQPTGGDSDLPSEEEHPAADDLEQQGSGNQNRGVAVAGGGHRADRVAEVQELEAGHCEEERRQ